MALNVTEEGLWNTTFTSPVPIEVEDPLDCPVWTDDDYAAYKMWKFINEGVFQVIISIFGLFGNALSIYILMRPDMRNSFNFLLISLLCFDSLYLFGAVLDNIRRGDIFGELFQTDVHTILFPYLLYPAMNIFMAASICMTAAIALERYIAVHYPIDYNLSTNCPKEMRRRLIKYLLPVIIFSISFNITKFMEARICWEWNDHFNTTYVIESLNEEDSRAVNITSIVTINATETHNANASNSDTYFQACNSDIPKILLQRDELMGISLWHPRITTTPMRWDPNYAIYYNNWARLLVLGIIPAGMLMYFNYKIYVDIKLRIDRRRQSTCGRVTANHQARRREEDNLAVVFMGIVGMFLACHMLKIFLSLHEMLVIRDALKCNKARKRGFPAWAEITTTFSHLALVINSSTNMIIYCILNSTFRQYFVKIVRNFLIRVSCGRILHCCPDENTVDDRQNGTLVATNTEHNRQISAIPPTELEMVEPDCTNDKTKLFDGENNLKVISHSFKPLDGSLSTTPLSDNSQNGGGSSDNSFHPIVTEV